MNTHQQPTTRKEHTMYIKPPTVTTHKTKQLHKIEVTEDTDIVKVLVETLTTHGLGHTPAYVGNTVEVYASENKLIEVVLLHLDRTITVFEKKITWKCTSYKQFNNYLSRTSVDIMEKIEIHLEGVIYNRPIDVAHAFEHSICKLYPVH